jgi:hypothetical protein
MQPAFTRALHWSLFWASSIQSIPPRLISLTSISILYSHLHISLLSNHVRSGFTTKSLCTFHYACYTPCPSHPFWFVHFIIFDLLNPFFLYLTVSRFFYFDHFTDGRTPWTSDQLVARPLPKHRTTQTHTKHPCLVWNLNPRSRVPERAKTVHALDRSATVTGIIFDKEYKLWSSSLRKFSPSSCYFIPFKV